MTDKEELKEIKKLADAMYYAAQYLTTDASRLHKAMDEYHKFIIREYKEESVSEDLGEYVNELSKQFPEVSFAKLSRIAVRVAKWQKQQDQSTIELAEDHAMLAGMEKMKEELMANIWKPADGVDLPEYEREVVVFTQNFPDDAGIMSVAIGHRPNPYGWDGKSLSTGKVEHYTPKTYGKGGWNIPDIVYWLDIELPKEIEL